MKVQLLNAYDIRLEKVTERLFCLHQNNHSDLKKQWDNIEEAKTNVKEMKNFNTKGILFIFGMQLQNGKLV